MLIICYIVIYIYILKLAMKLAYKFSCEVFTIMADNIEFNFSFTVI